MNEFISKAATLVEALPYLQKYRGKIFVFKYGGHAMSDPLLRESFLRDVILLKHVGIKPVIVHGGGPQIKETLAQLGVKSEYVNGLRVTDKETMKVVEMVLVGQVNSELVNRINKLGGLAVGYSGADGTMILGEKMPPQEIEEDGQKKMVDMGFVGRVLKVNPQLLLNTFKEELFIPIISPIGVDQEGQSLNINADTVACEIAKSLKAEKLMLLTDVKGVLGASKDLIADVDTKEVKALIADGTISGGMIPKIESALDSIRNGVGSVTILDGRVQHAILLEIFTDRGLGTLIHR